MFSKLFLRPFEKKKTVLLHGMAMPIHSSICPSEFSGLFSTCFQISIWNLVHTFSTWHVMLSLSFIIVHRTSSLSFITRPISEPKANQICFWYSLGNLLRYSCIIQHTFWLLQNSPFFSPIYNMIDRLLNYKRQNHCPSLVPIRTICILPKEFK